MKIRKSLAILGLLIIVLAANGFGPLTTNKVLTHLESVNEHLKEKSGGIQESFATNVIPLAKDPDQFENYIRIATGIASVIVPQPMGLIIGMVSTTFFAFSDALHAKKEKELQQLEETNELEKDNLFKENLIDNIEKIGSTIAVESQRVIDTVTKEINQLTEHVTKLSRSIIDELTKMFNARTLFYDLRKTLSYLNYYYTKHIDCLLKNMCIPNQRNNMMEKLMDPDSLFRVTLATFVTAFIDTTNTLPTSTGQEHGFFSYLSDGYKQRTNDGRDCDVETEQSEIYRLYVTIMLTLEKSYSMVTAAHMIRYHENTDNHTLAMQHFSAAMEMLRDSNADAVAVAKIVRPIISRVSTEIRRCDPIENKKGITYDRFVQLYGTYIGVTYDRFTNANGSHEYIDTARHPTRPWLIPESVHNGLFGVLYNNSKIRLGNKCQIKHDVYDITHYYNKADTDRFYHHIELFYKNGSREIYGKLNDGIEWSLTAQKYMSPFQIAGRSICKKCPGAVKICPATLKDSLYHVSLVSVEASPRHVVTGIRWRIKKKILHMEIQQARYVNGSIEANTIHWQDRPMHEIAQQMVPIERESVKGFVLDDVKLPAGYLLSGVQFLWNSNLTQGGGLIELKITGKQWEGDLSYSVSKNSTKFSENKMQRLAIDNADASEYAPHNALLSRPGENFVHFQMSDMKKDVAQSSIPYLDIQEVVSTPPRALQGIGLYYKGRAGFGGFVGLRAFIADISPQVDPEMLEHYGTSIKVMMDQLQDELLEESNEIIPRN